MIHHCDCLEYTRGLPDNSIDLIIGSPPYENARSYNIGFKLKGQAWVDWALERFIDQVRVCSGLVCWVVQGRTQQFRWSATPALLMADLHRAGIKLRTPPLYVRHGIPGSGGPDWWKTRYEFCICASKGRLPWSDNTATGHAPKYGKGGRMSNRDKSGARRFSVQSSRRPDGTRYKVLDSDRGRPLPTIANPGNLIDCGAATNWGKGNKNEAPYPEKLVQPFIVSFCRPGGLVYDPFSGSGTTGAVALREGRRFVGTEIRQDQCDLTMQRIAA